MRLEGFSPTEEEMVRRAQEALQAVGYDVSLLQMLIRADLPPGYRGMTWKDGAVLGTEAFSSQAMLNHVLEEELLHLPQKALGQCEVFGPETAPALEEAADAIRQFPLPEP